MIRPNRAGPLTLAPLAAFGILILSAGTIRLRSYDLFWHLAAGRWILEHRALPRDDPFRHTSEGTPWVDHEWLFQVLARGVEVLGGIDGLVVARLAVVAAIAALFLLAGRGAGLGVPGAVLVAAVGLMGARARFFLRPELASLLAVALLLTLLQRARRTGSRRPLMAAAALTVVWANLHPGALLAPGLAAAYLIGTRLPGGGRGEAPPPPWSRVLGTPVLLAGALMANPAGWSLFLVPLRIGGALRDLGASNPDWTPAWVSPQPAFLAGAAGLLLLVGVSVARGRGVDPATGLTALLLFVVAVTGVRHQGLYFAGAVFLAAETLAGLQRGGDRERAPGREALVIAAFCLLAAAWCVWPPPGGPLRPRQGPLLAGFGLEPGRFPTGGAAELIRRGIDGPLFNDVAFGGYLAWRLYPGRRIFIDGRNEVNAPLLREMVQARPDALRWNRLLERFGVEAALVRYDERVRPVTVPGAAAGDPPRIERHTASAVLYPPSLWALVHWDDTSLLFLRRGAGGEIRGSGDEYRWVQPEDWRDGLARAAADPRVRRGMVAELERRLREDPGCERADFLLRALISGRVGE